MLIIDSIYPVSALGTCSVPCADKFIYSLPKPSELSDYCSPFTNMTFEVRKAKWPSKDGTDSKWCFEMESRQWAEMQDTQVWSLGWDDPLGKGIPTPVFVPGESHGQRSLADYSPWGQRVGHSWAANTFTFTFKELRTQTLCSEPPYHSLATQLLFTGACLSVSGGRGRAWVGGICV